ncbi:hypothetical protein JXL19_08190 [bacterium]|nr:hypothetical protein [bacterium]
MGKEGFKGYICRPFCAFFRDGSKEELACRGALLVEYMLNAGIVSPDMIPEKSKSTRLWNRRDKDMERTVCQRCPFQKADCDFQSDIPPSGAEPCGGYILLSILKQKGIIGIADIEEADNAQ